MGVVAVGAAVAPAAVTRGGRATRAGGACGGCGGAGGGRARGRGWVVRPVAGTGMLRPGPPSAARAGAAGASAAVAPRQASAAASTRAGGLWGARGMVAPMLDG